MPEYVNAETAALHFLNMSGMFRRRRPAASRIPRPAPAMHGGHALAHQRRHTGPDGLAHHIQRHSAAGIKHAFASGTPCQKAQPTALSSALWRPRSSQAQRFARAAQSSCAPHGWPVKRQARRPWRRPAHPPIPAAGPDAAPRAAAAALPDCPARYYRCSSWKPPARRRGGSSAGGSDTIAPLQAFGADGNLFHLVRGRDPPSVSSRPSASCGRSGGVHTTRKAGCSFT